jgi:hypothetical protein
MIMNFSSVNENKKEAIIIPPDRVGRQAIRIVGPLVVVYLLLFAFLWTDRFTLNAFKQAFPDNPLVVLAILAGGIVAHEGLHGLTWALFCKGGLRSIRFGFMVKLLAPYCHCTVPVKLIPYILGGLMPGVVMGILPAAWALWQGSMGWLLFAIFFTTAAGGDFAMMRLLWPLPASVRVKDHPSELGCYIYYKN